MASKPAPPKAAAPPPDMDKMTEEEKLIFKKYGKLPQKKDLIGHKLKERKFFDSGDYALMKAGNKGATVGQDHPSPDMIPHSNPSGNHQPNVPHHMATMNAGDGSSTPKEEEKV